MHQFPVPLRRKHFPARLQPQLSSLLQQPSACQRLELRTPSPFLSGHREQSPFGPSHDEPLSRRQPKRSSQRRGLGSPR